MALTVAPELESIVRPGVLWLHDAVVTERDSRLDQPLSIAEAAVRAHPPDEVVAVRTMYKRVGLDPTKRRPSSEALLRRVRKGDPLPRINAMVDVCNWCSLEFQLPERNCAAQSSLVKTKQAHVNLANSLLKKQKNIA